MTYGTRGGAHQRLRAGGRIPRLRRTGLVLGVLVLAGCFDYSEDIWLYQAGDGRLEAEVLVPARIWQKLIVSGHTPADDLRTELETLSAGIAALTLDFYAETSTGTHQRLRWAYSFRTQAALAELLDRSAALAGRFHASDWPPEYEAPPQAEVATVGRTTTYYRRFPPWRAAARGMPGAMDGLVRLTVHAPAAITDHTSGELDGTGRSVTWEADVEAFLRQGFEQRVTVEREIPFAVFAGGAVGVLVGMMAVWGLALRHMVRASAPAEAAEATASLTSPRAGSDEFGGDWSDE